MKERVWGQSNHNYYNSKVNYKRNILPSNFLQKGLGPRAVVHSVPFLFYSAGYSTSDDSICCDSRSECHLK